MFVIYGTWFHPEKIHLTTKFEQVAPFDYSYKLYQDENWELTIIRKYKTSEFWVHLSLTNMWSEFSHLKIGHIKVKEKITFKQLTLLSKVDTYYKVRGFFDNYT